MTTKAEQKAINDLNSAIEGKTDPRKKIQQLYKQLEETQQTANTRIKLLENTIEEFKLELGKLRIVLSSVQQERNTLQQKELSAQLCDRTQRDIIQKQIKEIVRLKKLINTMCVIADLAGVLEK